MPALTIDNRTAEALSIQIVPLACVIASAESLNLLPGMCSPPFSVSLAPHDYCLAGEFNIVITGTNGVATLPIVLDQLQQAIPYFSLWSYSPGCSGACMYAALVGDQIQVLDAFLDNPVPQPSLWSQPRPLSSAEQEGLESLMPGTGFSPVEIKVYDNVTPTYNCLAWAMGITVTVLPDPMPTVDITVEQLGMYLRSTATQIGLSDPTANIIAWGTGNVVKHVIVYRRLGDGNKWSSKLGFRPVSGNSAVGLLVNHDENAYQGMNPGPYGSPIEAFHSSVWPVPPTT